MIDTIIGMGMVGILFYIATKVAVLNDMSHLILEELREGRKWE